MSNVVESIPEEFRAVFVDVLGKRNAALLSALRTQDKPTAEQREAVDDIFSDEVVRELGPGHVPTERGQLVTRTIEEFWYQWPNDPS